MNCSLGLPAEYATDHGIIAAAEATGQALQSIRFSACWREHRVCCFQTHRFLENTAGGYRHSGERRNPAGFFMGFWIPANAGMTGWTALLQATSKLAVRRPAPTLLVETYSTTKLPC